MGPTTKKPHRVDDNLSLGKVDVDRKHSVTASAQCLRRSACLTNDLYPLGKQVALSPHPPPLWRHG